LAPERGRAFVLRREPRVAATLRAMGPTRWRAWLFAALTALGVAWGALAVVAHPGGGALGSNVATPSLLLLLAVGLGAALVSAGLRVSGAAWRHPVTRAAEGLAAAALLVAAPLWLAGGDADGGGLTAAVAVGLFLAASLALMYLAAIPDLATCRDHLRGASPLRRTLYGAASLGWRGSPGQRARHRRRIGVLALALVPLALLVQWALAERLDSSTTVAARHLGGAVFAGIGAVLVLLGVLRRALRLETVLVPPLFARLGHGLLLASLAWAGLVLLDLTLGAGPADAALSRAGIGDVRGRYFATLVLCLLAPLVLVLAGRDVTRGAVLAGLSVNVGLWLERSLFVGPAPASASAPAWVEWGLLAGSCGAVALLFAGLTRLVPVISLWELPPVELPADGTAAPVPASVRRAVEVGEERGRAPTATG
jgi:molybdopterin-containing oxidoreductase family membrane subunit